MENEKEISVYRRGHFNAAHRLFVNDWDFDQNQKVFGKCNNPYFHGHNYEIEVCLTGKIDPITGMLINLDDLKKLISEEVEEYLDHKNLNEQIEEFKNLNPTVENICIVAYNRIRKKLDEKYKVRVRLYETKRNYAEYGD
ncbi:MAG: 6-carboxytetrahydropterin synthase [Saprospirales bacterium]|nr:MAG: 6-carboxytetrahydropterin synthase [Saprospirales bacterium]